MFRNQPSGLVNETDKLWLNRSRAAGGTSYGSDMECLVNCNTSWLLPARWRYANLKSKWNRVFVLLKIVVSLKPFLSLKKTLQNTVNYKMYAFSFMSLHSSLRVINRYQRLRVLTQQARHWTNVGLMLAHCLRRWINIDPTLSCVLEDSMVSMEYT